MKKFFTLCASLLLSFGAFAQDVDLESFIFTDLEGNEVKDGSTIVVNKINKEGQMVVPLRAVNKSGEKQAVSMYETIDAMPNGGWQTCAFGNCMQLSATGYSSKNVMTEDYNSTIETEWMPVVGQYGTWEATLQIHIFNITYKTSFGTKVETAGNEIIAYGPKVNVRFEYTESSSQSAETYILSPVSNEELGQGNGFRDVTGKLAVFNEIPINDIDIFDGGKVVKMRVGLASATEISHVYIYPIYGGYIQDPIVDEAVSGGTAGWNEFVLSTPVTLNMEGWESILIGFEYNQTVDNYPLSITSSNYNLIVYGNFGQGVGYYGAGKADLSVQAIVEKELDKYNVLPSYFGDFVIAPGESTNGYMNIRNRGSETVNNISYTVNVGGIVSEEQTAQVSQPLNLGQEGYIEVPFSSAASEGTQSYVVTVTKVNGEPNVNTNNSVEGLLATTSRSVEHRVAVEEYTGTMCGWCPRGLVGMEKLRDAYGDKFIGIGIHQYNSNRASQQNTLPDAMYLDPSTYALLPFAGAPSCMLNRMVLSDPYYGFTKQNGDIVEDFQLALNMPAHAGLSVKGEWNADSTQVTATATIDPLVDGAEYTIEYALVADGLTSTGNGFAQANYYASQYSSQTSLTEASLPSDLKFLWKAGTSYRPIFNDVCIAGSFIDYENKTTAITNLTAGQLTTNTFTLSMPTYATLANAIKKDQVWVVALLVNRLGEVVNAAKALLPSGTSAISSAVNVNTSVVERYWLDGRQMPSAQKGLNIVRMADGSVRKVMVK